MKWIGVVFSPSCQWISCFQLGSFSQEFLQVPSTGKNKTPLSRKIHELKDQAIRNGTAPLGHLVYALASVWGSVVPTVFSTREKTISYKDKFGCPGFF